MSRTDKQLYKVIADVICRSVPKGWQKAIVSASVADDTGEAVYDYVDGSGKKSWFAPDTREQYEVYTAFQELRAMMKATGHSWGKARFTLEPSGKFDIDFDYEG